jgi:quinoprotein glucose dehydrogenase
VPPPPMLATINSGGESRDVVVQTGKHPTMFIFDRDTGEPVFPVIDKPVPRDVVPGEQACATQPWPLHPDPLVRTSLYESDITRITPESHAFVLERFRQLRTGPTYTPASIEGTITMPGIHGGNQWGGGAFDPETNIVYVNVNNVPFILRLDPIPPDQFEEMTAVQRARHTYTANCAVCHGADRQGNPGVPRLVDLPHTTGELRTIIAAGFGNMPAFPTLSDSQLDELVAYLESEVDATGFDPATEIGGELTWSGSGGRADLEWTTTTPQYVNSLSYFTDHMGLPAIQPPWGELVAIDIAEGQILWKVPLGEYPVLVDSLGIRNTGTENLGGLVATAGGLIFVAATKDSKFRAFDKSNGQVLWEFQMDAPGFSSPSVYEIDGRQYVAIVAGGGARRFRAPHVAPGIGRKVHVFALPD